MNRAARIAFVALVALGGSFAESRVEAQPPRLLPIHGMLTDAAGVPIDGTATVTFSLYASSSSSGAVFSETRSVVVEDGAFVVYMGEITSLDLALFRDNASVYLGIQVGADPEMTPRLALGTVPYAAYSAHCGDAETVGGQPASALGGVPSGAVMFFDLPACPPGWTELNAARGRALVGLPQGGTAGGSVGTALTDLEARAHTHAVDPASVQTTAAGAHTHDYAGQLVSTTAAGFHSHSVDPPSTASNTTGAHTHAWMQRSAIFTSTFDSAGNTINGQIGAANFAAGSAGLGLIVPGTGQNFTTSSGDHAHTVDVAAFTSGTVPAHQHDVLLPGGTTDMVQNHDHAVDVPSTSSTAATTEDVMPYVQLLVCRRD